MAKTKSVAKATKKKAKPAKPAKVVKKNDKIKAQKPLKQAKAKGTAKDSTSAVKKSPSKKDKKQVIAATPDAKNNAKALKVASQKTEKDSQQKPTKADAKTKAKSKKADKKGNDDDMDDDLIGEDFGDSEIAEYEEDLRAVENEDDSVEDDIEDFEEDEDKKDEEVYLTDSEGRRLCKVRDCDQVANVEGYCRFHYLLLWKKIQIRKSILNDGKLEKYVEDLTSRYPDKFLEVIKKDLKTEKDFLSVIQEMELDENALNEIEGEDEVQSFADEIRGIGEAQGLDEDGDF